MEFKVGRPPTLTDEVKARILDAIPKVIIPSQVAAMARVPKQSLSRWLIDGEKDSSLGIDSIFAQLWDDFKAIQAKVLNEYLDDIRACPKNYGALTWTLEKCFREDFGKESEEFRQIMEKFAVIFPLLGKGAQPNEREAEEVDSKDGN